MSVLCRRVLLCLAASGSAGLSAAELENLARGKSYTFSASPNYALCTDSGDNRQLTDGEALKSGSSARFWCRKEAVGWSGGGTFSRQVTLDLGKDEAIAGFSWNYAAGAADVCCPELIFVYVSADGKRWRFVGDLMACSAAENGVPAKTGYALHCARSTQMPCHGRYVAFRVRAVSYIFVDEIEVYRGPASNCVETGDEAFFESPGAHDKACRKHKVFMRDVDTIARAVQALPSNEYARCTADLYRLNARIARAKGFSQSVFWACDRWANGDLVSLPTFSAVKAPVGVEMMRGESRSVAVNLTNPHDQDKAYMVECVGFPAEANVEIREVVPTLVKQGARVAGLLLPNNATTQLTVTLPAGTTRQFWITFAKPTLAKGTYAGRIVAGTAVKEITLKMADLDFPAHPRLHVGGWDYSNGGNTSFKSPRNLSAKMARMREMFVDSPWATSAVMPNGAKFDAAGKLLNARSLDFSNWNAWVDLWGDQARQYCVFMSVGRAFHGEKMGTPRFENMVGEYMRAWQDGIKARLNGRRVVILLVDEPRMPEMDERTVAWAKPIKARAPEFVIFDDISYDDPRQASKGLIDVSDILCPPTPHMTAHRQEDYYRQKAREGKELWLYSCCGPSRTFDPILYYRAQAWHAWRIGAKATMFWAFGCGGGIGDSFRPFEQKGQEYSPFFVSPTDAFRAKQSEAILESVEDYEYLALLRERVALLKVQGRNVAAYEQLLATACDRALPEEAWLKNHKYIYSRGVQRYDWFNSINHDSMDAVRLEILHALEGLK